MSNLAPHDDNLIWIDLEMTGLSPENDRVIEVAVVVTDPACAVRVEGPVIAVHQSDAVLDAMDAWNKGTHGRSGLVDRVKASTIDEASAQQQVVAWLAAYVPAGKSPMCGNTICQDRRFLAKHMPDLERCFHYRNLDVTTLKELAKRWKPAALEGLVKPRRTPRWPTCTSRSTSCCTTDTPCWPCSGPPSTQGDGMTTRDDSFVAAADAMGFDMPENRPAGQYAPVVLDSRYAHLAGHIPRVGNRVSVTGAAGRDVSLERAREGARICAMRLLTLLQGTLGSLDCVLQVMRMNVYVQSASDFALQSEVADAASDLLVRALEDARAHARTSIGVLQRPKNATVEIDLVVAYEAGPLNMTTMMSTLT